jgi:microcystin-dependent protein
VADPFVGEIRCVGFTFAPQGWAFCDGALLPISQNTALFSLLGTFYGGNGTTTFALPNLKDRSPMHVGQKPGGSTYIQGQTGGAAGHALSVAEMPGHTHQISGRAVTATTAVPTGALWARSAKPAYAATADTAMGPSIGDTGTGSPHENRPPYLVLNFIIALQGVFPARS